MKVFKFGGASLKNADAIRNIVSIIKLHGKENLVVVVSAMGKTTDALEQIITLSQAGKSFERELHALATYHQEIMEDLFTDPKGPLLLCSQLLKELKNKALQKGAYDFVYDQVIGYGELISSHIIHLFLAQEDLPAAWIDSRRFIKTDSSFREGKIQWAETESNLQPLKTTLNDQI